jgi:hypothetical protein
MKEIEITLIGREEETPDLFDVVNFLYDFNVAYEIARLATDPEHQSFRFSHFVFYRNGRPLRKNERLRLAKLEHGSPTKLVGRLTATSLAVGALWGIVQIYCKIEDHPLEHRKLAAEARKVELEVLELETKNRSYDPAYRPHVISNEKEFQDLLLDRGASGYFDQAVKRLEKSPVRIEEIEIRLVDDER